jgi:glycosyltransferase involved in cell wall biosynthesis
MKNIAIITQFYPPDLGGMQVSNGLIVESFAEYGFNVELYILGRSKGDLNNEGKIKKHYRSFMPVSFFGHLKTVNLLKEVFSKSFDLIFILDESPVRALGLYPFKLNTHDTPIVSINSGSTLVRPNNHLKGKLNALLVQRGYKYLRKLFVSHTVFNQIKEAHPELSDRVSVLGRPIPNSFFFKNHQATWPPENRLPVLVASGRANKYKGVDLILLGLKILADKQGKERVKLYYAGDGEELEKWKELSKKLGLNNVVFLGYKPLNELINIYRSSDFFILPSTSDIETFGRVWMESMACSKPSISTTICNLSHLIKDNHNAIVVEPTAESVANGIEKAIQLSKKQYYELSKNAYNTASLYRQNKIIDTLVKTLKNEKILT